MTKEVQKWADEAMFTAEKSDAKKGIEVHFLQGTPDPLGSIVAFSAMYTGKVVRNKADVTDEERRYHLREMEATKLKAPLEAVSMHFMVDGVTRSFTHQMVRQRTAVYAQESLRFAVKEDAGSAIALPPSLAGTTSLEEWCERNGFDPECDPEAYLEFDRESDMQQVRLKWDYKARDSGEFYNWMVNKGMPAEDARGALWHSITTRLNYSTNLRSLQDHSGNRLCTQAQFEWRIFWIKLLESMRNYCTGPKGCLHSPGVIGCDNWQWKAIANLFRPVCYFTGKCEFMADFDRKCNIRDRVQANHEIGRDSTEWADELGVATQGSEGGVARGGYGEPVFIGAIHPAEWLLDHGAAR